MRRTQSKRGSKGRIYNNNGSAVSAYKKFTLQTINVGGDEHNYTLFAENEESAMEKALRFKQNVSGIMSILALN